MEPTVKYQPGSALTLTWRKLGTVAGGSLTGAVASKKVTEAFKGRLRLNGNQPQSAKAEAGLTARRTCRAERKRGLSDPTARSGTAVA